MGGAQISANEAAQLAYKFPFLQEWITQDERGYYRNEMLQELILSFPVLGTELPRAANLVMGESVDWDRGTAKGMAWMLADFLGNIFFALALVGAVAWAGLVLHMLGFIIRYLESSL